MIEYLANLMMYVQTTIANSLDYFGGLTLLLFVLLIINQLSGGLLSIFGIIPRKVWGIQGIFLAPFIHASFDHFFFNLIPLFVLSVMLMLYGFDFYYQISVVLIIFSGSLIWLFARPGVHVGASALITAYWGFLVTDSLFKSNSILNIATGFICVYYFFGIFFGIFPSQKRVSWEGHLFGLIAGVITCLFYNISAVL